MTNTAAGLLESTRVEEVTVSEEQRFLFDLHGCLHLPGVLTAADCKLLLATVRRLEAADYDETARLQRTYNNMEPQPTLQLTPGRTRLNGLLRLDPLFDELIDHPQVLPFLRELMQEPQLINTWSISKVQGEPGGGWHRGRPAGYRYHNGVITSQMLNTVWFLTDNGPQDGCMGALLGGHKSNVDLQWRSYDGMAMPGATRVTGRAGDVFVFSEAVLHNGMPKTSAGTRTNLYYNWGTRDFNVMTYSPQHNYHFCMPPAIRDRFTPRRRALTEWMEFAAAQD